MKLLHVVCWALLRQSLRGNQNERASIGDSHVKCQNVLYDFDLLQLVKSGPVEELNVVYLHGQICMQ